MKIRFYKWHELKTILLPNNSLEPLGLEISLPILWSRIRTDRAVLSGFLTQFWQVFAGPITLLLVVRYLTRETQGYYYSFGSFLGIQVFFEMGFSTTLLYICSHEWAHLQLDSAGKVIGDPKALARLASLGRLVFKWYALASCLFVIGVGLGGYLFLDSSSQYNINWKEPWIAVVLVTGILFWTAPFISMLDGCSQIAVTNKFRLYQAVLTTCVLWLILFLGGGLWAVLASACSRILCNIYLFVIRFRNFFALFWQSKTAEYKVSWKHEIWPLQWRTGLTAIFSYFGSSLFVPVMFRYHGAAIAGQIGMTLSLIGMLQVLALVFLSTRAPRFGMFIAKRQYAELDRVFIITCIVSLVVYFVGAGIFLSINSILYATGSLYATRILPPFPTLLLLVANMLLMLSICESVYLLAHKRMPLSVILPPVIGNLGAGIMVWALGSKLGTTGAASGYLGMMLVLVIWETIVWIRCRQEWHTDCVNLEETLYL